MIKKIWLSLLIFLLMTSSSEAAVDLSNKAELQNARFSYGSGTVRIVLDITKKVEFTESYAENPSRLVLSLKDAWIDTKKMKRDMALNSTAARHIKIAQFDASTVRVVIETMADVNIFWLNGGPSGYRLVVDVGNSKFQENPDLNKQNQDKPKEESKPIKQPETPKVENPKPSEPETKPAIVEEPEDKDIQPFDDEKQIEASKKEIEKLKKELDKREKELIKREKELDKREKELNERELKLKEKSNKSKVEKIKEDRDKKSKDTDIDKDLSEITALKDKKIVIDPGHGGNDSGAIGPTGVTEKSVTLRVGTRLKELLEDEGATVIMTRETDKTVAKAGAKASDIEELQARCDVANKAKSDIFVSIHADSFTNPASRGTTGYYYSKSEDGRSQKLADSIRRALCDAIGTPSRGTKPCNFYVVRHTDMPATLIELAFISNPEEEAILDSDDGIEAAAQGIFDGIEDYFG